MKYQHTSSLEWMKARQKYLSASGIKELLPVTPTGRKRSEDQIIKATLTAYASTLVELTLDDCMSFNDAARGHILEAFAIREFNKLGLDEQELFHWDDALITDGLTAFSPDAMSYKQMNRDIIEYGPISNPNVWIVMGEVKSYETGKHLARGKADKMQLEERWQIATAMYVEPQLHHVWLIFFNPKMKNPEHRLFVHSYNRQELENEISMVEECAIKYANDAADLKESLADIGYECEITEAEIIQLISGGAGVLNP